MKRTILALALGLAIAGCGSAASSHKGYYNMRTLSSSLRDEMTSAITLDNFKGDGLPAISDINCIHTDGQHADCLVTYGDSSTDHVSVAISANGDSWISH